MRILSIEIINLFVIFSTHDAFAISSYKFSSKFDFISLLITNSADKIKLD